MWGWIERAVGFRLFTTIAVMTLAVGGGTGCHFVKAVANPRAAFAVNEPAPMGVVVRRADSAETTAKEVDRLLTATPADADTEWVAKITLDADEAKASLETVAASGAYKGAPARILAVEAWAKKLATVKASDAAAPSPASPAAAPAAEPVAEPVVDKKADPKSKKTAAAPAKGTKKAKGAADAPVETKTVVAAVEPAKVEPPPPSPDITARSILGVIGKELVDSYRSILAKHREIGDIKEKIRVVEEALDKATTDEEKAAKKQEKKDLKLVLSTAEDEVRPLEKAFLKSVEDGSAKVSGDVPGKLGAALVNLRQAVLDAKTANSAALVRYPMALPSILGDTKRQVRIIVEDIVEEKTGKRPDLTEFSPGVTIEDWKPQVTLNGLSSDDMSKISMGELTSETSSRATKFLGRVLVLGAKVAETQEALGFEEDVLDAMIDGFKKTGWTAPDPIKIEPREAEKPKKN
jgi:hypothetical protein